MLITFIALDRTKIGARIKPSDSNGYKMQQFSHYKVLHTFSSVRHCNARQL